MSILEKNLIFSDKQFINGTEDSESTVDIAIGEDYLGNDLVPESSYGGKMRLRARVTTTFSGGTSVALKLQESANDSGWADTDIVGPAISVGTLKEGYDILDIPLPAGLKRYLKGVYTAVGNPNAGRVSMWISF